LKLIITIFIFTTTLLAMNNNFDLGMQYLLGNGKVIDKNKAMYYLTKAQQEGDAEATYNLALMYYTGDGIKQDIKKAAELLDEAASKKFIKAIQNVGRVYMQLLNFEKAIYWLIKNAQNGDNQANYFLAELYIAQGNLKMAKIYTEKAMGYGIKDAKNLWKEHKLFNY